MQEIVRSTRGLKSRRLKGKARLNRKITLCLASIICCLSFVAVGVLASLTDVSISIDNDAYYYATAFNKNANDEFIIRTYDDLVAMSNLVNSNTLVPDTNVYYKDAKYYLANDIDPVAEAIANGTSEADAKSRTYPLSPIGKNSESAFSGVFRGDGHTISNVTIGIEASEFHYYGIFGYTAGATINGVGLGTPLNPTTNVFDYSGISVTGSSLSLGTLVGYATGKYDGEGKILRQTTISECYSYSNMHISSAVVNSAFSGIEDPVWGMLVGRANNGVNISNCYTTGYAYSGVTLLDSPIISVCCDYSYDLNYNRIESCYSLASNSEANIYLFGDAGIGRVNCITGVSTEEAYRLLNRIYCFNSTEEDSYPSGNIDGVYLFTSITKYENMSDEDALSNEQKMNNLDPNYNNGNYKWVACPNGDNLYYFFPQLKIFLEAKIKSNVCSSIDDTTNDENKDNCYYHFKKVTDLDVHNFVYDPYDSYYSDFSLSNSENGAYLHGSKGGNTTFVSHYGILKDAEKINNILTAITDKKSLDFTSLLDTENEQVADLRNDCKTTCSMKKLSFALGEEITISANPNDDFDFVGFVFFKNVDYFNNIEMNEIFIRIATMVGKQVYAGGGGIVSDYGLDCDLIDTYAKFFYDSADFTKTETDGNITYTLNQRIKVDFDTAGNMCFVECDENGTATSSTSYFYIAALYRPKMVTVEGTTLLSSEYTNNAGETIENNGGNCDPALLQFYGERATRPLVIGTGGALDYLSRDSQFLSYYGITNLLSNSPLFYISNYKGSGVVNNGNGLDGGNNNKNNYHYLTIVAPNVSYSGFNVGGTEVTYTGTAHIFNGFYYKTEDSDTKIKIDDTDDTYIYTKDIEANGTTAKLYCINVLFNKNGNLNLLDKDGKIVEGLEITNICSKYTENTIILNMNMVLYDTNGNKVENATFPKDALVGATGYVSYQNTTRSEDTRFFTNSNSPFYNAGVGIESKTGQLDKNYGCNKDTISVSYKFMKGTPVTLLADEYYGYNFYGFYTDENCTTPAGTRNADKTTVVVDGVVKTPTFASANLTLPTDGETYNIYVKYRIKTINLSINTGIIKDSNKDNTILEGSTDGSKPITIWDANLDKQSHVYGQFYASISYPISDTGVISSENVSDRNIYSAENFCSYGYIYIEPTAYTGYTFNGIWAKKKETDEYVKLTPTKIGSYYYIQCNETGIQGLLSDPEENAVTLVVVFVPDNNKITIGTAHEGYVDGSFLESTESDFGGSVEYSGDFASEKRPYMGHSSYGIKEKRNDVLIINSGSTFILAVKSEEIGYIFKGWYGVPTNATATTDIEISGIDVKLLSTNKTLTAVNSNGNISYNGETYSVVYALFIRDLIKIEDPIHTAVGGKESDVGTTNVGGVAQGDSTWYNKPSADSAQIGITGSGTTNTTTVDNNGNYQLAGSSYTKHKSWLKVTATALPGYKFIGYTTDPDNLSTPQISVEDFMGSTTIYIELLAVDDTRSDVYLSNIKFGNIYVEVAGGGLKVTDPTNVGATINLDDGEWGLFEIKSYSIYALFERIPIADAIHGLNGMGISLENGTLSDGTNDSSTDAFHTANEPVLNEGLASGSDPMGEVQVSYVSSKRLTTTDAEGNILITTTYTTFDNQNNNCNHISLNGDINDLFIINIFPYYGFKIKDIYLKTSSGWSQLDAESNTIKVTDGTVTPENQGVALYDYYYRLAINRTETTQTETAVSNAGAFTEGVTEFSFTTSGETTTYSAIIVTFEPEDYNISYAPNGEDIYARSLVRKSGTDVFHNESAVQWKYPVDGTATYGDKPSGENTLKSTHSYAYNEKYQKTGFSTYAELFKNSYGQNCSDATSNYYIQNNESKGAYEVAGYVFLGWGLYTSDGYLSLAITTDYYLYGVEGATAESVAKTYASILAKLDNVTYFTHSSSTEVGLTFNANIQDNNGNYQNLSRLLYGYRDANNTTELKALWVPETGTTEHDTYLVIHGFGDVKVGDNNHLNLNTYTTYGVGSSIGYDLSMPLKDASKILLLYSRYGLQIDYGFSKRTINFTAIANNDSAKFMGFNNWKTTDHSFAQYKAGRYSGISLNETINITNLDLTREDNNDTLINLCLNIYAETDNPDTVNPFCTVESITDESGNTNTYRFIHLYAVWQRSVDIYQGNVDGNGDLSDMEESDDDTETAAATASMGLKIDTLTKNIAFTNAKLTSQTAFSLELPNYLVSGYTHKGFVTDYYTGTKPLLTLDTESGKYKVNYDEAITTPTLLNTVQLTQKTQNAFAIYSKELILYYSNSLTEGGDAYHIQSLTNTYYYYIVKQNGIAIEKYFTQDPLAYPHSDGETYEIGWHIGGFYAQDGVTALDTNLTFVGYTSSGFITPETSTPANFYPYVEIVAGSGNYAFAEGSPLPLTETSQTYYAVYKGASTIYANFSETKQGDTLLFPLKSFYIDSYTNLEFSESDGMKEFFSGTTYADCRYPFTATKLCASINGVMVNNTDIYFCAYQENGGSGLDPYSVQAGTMYTGFQRCGFGNEANANHPEFAYYTVDGWTDYAGWSRVWNTTSGTATNWYNTLDYGTTDAGGNTITRSYYVKYNGNAYASVADGGDGTCDAYGVSKFISVLPGKSVDLYPVFRYQEATASGDKLNGEEVINPIVLDEEASKYFVITDFKYSYDGTDGIKSRATFDRQTASFQISMRYMYLCSSSIQFSIKNYSKQAMSIYFTSNGLKIENDDSTKKVSRTWITQTETCTGDGVESNGLNSYLIPAGKTATIVIKLYCNYFSTYDATITLSNIRFRFAIGSTFATDSNSNLFQTSKDVFYNTDQNLEASIIEANSNTSYKVNSNSNVDLYTSSTANCIVVKFTNNKYSSGAKFGVTASNSYFNCVYGWSTTGSFGTLTQQLVLGAQYSSVVSYGDSIYLKIKVNTVSAGNYVTLGFSASNDAGTEFSNLSFAYTGVNIGARYLFSPNWLNTSSHPQNMIQIIAGYTTKANTEYLQAHISQIYNRLTYFNLTNDDKVSAVNYYTNPPGTASAEGTTGDIFILSAENYHPGFMHIQMRYKHLKDFVEIRFNTEKENTTTNFVCSDNVPSASKNTALIRYGYIIKELNGEKIPAPNGKVYNNTNLNPTTSKPSSIAHYVTATKTHAVFLGWYTSRTSSGVKILDSDGKFNLSNGCVAKEGYIEAVTDEDGNIGYYWASNNIDLYPHFSDTVYAVMVCNNFEGSVPNGVANEHEYSSLTCTSHSSFVKSDTLPYLNYDVINTANNLVYDLNGYYQDLNYDGNKTDGNWHISPTGTSGVYKYVPFSNANKTDICDHYIIWYVSEGQTGTSGREGFYLKLCGITDSDSGELKGNCDIKISGLAIPTVRDTDEGDYTAAANDSDSTLAKFRRGNSWKMTQFTTQYGAANINITSTVGNALNPLNTAGNMVPITLSGSSHYITLGNGIITANYERLYTKITLDASVSVYNSLFIGEGKFPDEKTKKTVFTYYGANAVYTNGDCLTGGKISSTNFKNRYCPTREISDKTIDCIYKFIAWSYYKTSSTFAEVISTNNTFISNALSFTTLSRWSYYDKADTNGIELYALFDYDYNERMDLLLKVAPNTQEITITTGSLNVVSINIGKQSTTGVADITQITYKYKNLGNSLIKRTINEISSISDIEGILFDISDLTSSSNKISAKYKASHTITGFYTTNKLDINAFFFQFSEDPASDLSENYTPDTYILLSLPKDYVYCIKYTEKELINDGIFEYILTEDSAGKIKYDYYTASGARGVIDDSSQPTQIDTTSNADYYSFTYHYSISERLLYLANNPEYKKVVVYGYSSNATLDGIAVDINKPQSLADRWEIEGNGWLLGRYTSLLSASQGANSNKNIEYLEIVDDVQVDSNITLHSYVYIFGTNNNITIKFGPQTDIQVLDIGLIICDLKANYFSFIDSSGDIDVYDCEIKGEISIKCSKVKLYDVTCSNIRIKDSDPTKTKLYINGNVTFNNKKNRDIEFYVPIKESVDPCIEINVVLTCDIEIVTEDISEILESSSSRVNIVKSKNKSLKTYISLRVKHKYDYGVEGYYCYRVDYDETKSIYYVSGRAYVVNIKKAIENETIQVGDIIRVHICQISVLRMGSIDSDIYEYTIADTANDSMYDYTITKDDIARGFFYLQFDPYIKGWTTIQVEYKEASINGNELKYEIETSKVWDKNYISKKQSFHSIIGQYYNYKVDGDCSFNCLSFFYFELQRKDLSSEDLLSKKIKIDASSYTDNIYFSTFNEITTAYQTTYNNVLNKVGDTEKAYVSGCDEYFLITSAIKGSGGYFYLK